MSRESHIHVRRTARYYTLGPQDRSVGDVWFVLHGYGQLAAEFIRIFETLDDGTRLIVAPEALNRFYMVGVESAPAAERPVGATWMTREDRVNEIDDYVAYLDAVAGSVLGAPGASENLRVTLLGFSQGAATATRWVAHGALRPQHLVLWGGFPPPEIDMSARDHPVHATTLRILAGTRDRFVSAERLADEEQRLRDAAVEYRLVRYAGGHGIPKDALLELARSIGGPST